MLLTDNSKVHERHLSFSPTTLAKLSISQFLLANLIHAQSVLSRSDPLLTLERKLFSLVLREHFSNLGELDWLLSWAGSEAVISATLQALHC